MPAALTSLPFPPLCRRYELLNEKDQSLDWYQKLLAFVPADPSLLNRLSDISEAERDRHQSLAYLNEVRLLIGSP